MLEDSTMQPRIDNPAQSVPGAMQALLEWPLTRSTRVWNTAT
jgi:hypothetical protein